MRQVSSFYPLFKPLTKYIMGLKDILFGKKKNGDEYVDAEHIANSIDDTQEIGKEIKRAGKYRLVYDKLTSYNDTQNVINLFRDGKTILIIDILQIQQEKFDDLKRSIDRVKKTVEVTGGDMVVLPNSLLLVVPKTHIILKRKKKVTSFAEGMEY
ncbi:MAG: hypothetical protein CVU81_03230 [Euryarchaeota archaeon HGW-Euryarchaeota-1]|nr:MAG: hypothetical protein CVU81_03230 [Euryarchaeota archaeon HGW-Euryarchaeota-1]